jgi:ABC-type iron transport system FetAB permease component
MPIADRLSKYFEWCLTRIVFVWIWFFWVGLMAEKSSEWKSIDLLVVIRLFIACYVGKWCFSHKDTNPAIMAIIVSIGLFLWLGIAAILNLVFETLTGVKL